MRVFVPSSKWVRGTTVPTCVKAWTWKRGRGLRVIHTNGTELRSEYTLPELLDSGEACEVADGFGPSWALELSADCDQPHGA
jgi:hypothetical protein